MKVKPRWMKRAIDTAATELPRLPFSREAKVNRIKTGKVAVALRG